MYIYFVLILFAIIAITLIIIIFLSKKNNTSVERLEPNDLELVKNFQRIPLPNYKIPQKLFQTQEKKLVPKKMYQSMLSIYNACPSCSYTFYDSNDSREYIKKYYPDALDAYDSLVPGAYKADLFRHIRLYNEGGIYFDSPMNIPENIKILGDIIQPDDEFVASYDNKIEKNGIRYIYNAFLASVPKHPIIKKVIDMSIKAIMNKDYRHDDLSITGPGILGEAAHEVGLSENKNNVRYFEHNGNKKIMDLDKVLIITRYDDYDNHRKYFTSLPHYHTLWVARKVFRH